MASAWAFVILTALRADAVTHAAESCSFEKKIAYRLEMYWHSCGVVEYLTTEVLSHCWHERSFYRMDRDDIGDETQNLISHICRLIVRICFYRRRRLSPA